MGNWQTSLKIEESVSKACKPGMRMIFLGILINTEKMTLELDINRLQEINNLLTKWGSKTYTKLKEVQRLVGVLSFAVTCIKQGRAFFAGTLNFLRDMPYNGQAEIPVKVRKDINWRKYV